MKVCPICGLSTLLLAVATSSLTARGATVDAVQPDNTMKWGVAESPKLITLDFTRANITDILDTIARQGDVKISVGPDVTGVLKSIHLTDKTPEQAIRLIARVTNYGFKKLDARTFSFGSATDAEAATPTPADSARASHLLSLDFTDIKTEEIIRMLGFQANIQIFVGDDVVGSLPKVILKDATAEDALRHVALMANLKFEKKDEQTFLIGKNATRELTPSKRVFIDGASLFFKSVQIQNAHASEVLQKIADRGDFALTIDDPLGISLATTIENFRLDNCSSDEALCAVAASVGLQCTPRIEASSNGEKYFMGYVVTRIPAEVFTLRRKSLMRNFSMPEPFINIIPLPFSPPEKRDPMLVHSPRAFQYSDSKRDRNEAPQSEKTNDTHAPTSSD